jgi:hypothetical protein
VSFRAFSYQPSVPQDEKGEPLFLIWANKGVGVTKQIIINNHFPFIGKTFQILGYIDTLVGNIKNKHKIFRTVSFVLLGYE